MVIGDGMVAKAFNEYSNNHEVVIFASGVSNSKSADIAAFSGEERLLKETILMYATKKLVYFSTFNLYDPDESHSPYCLHKLHMEKIIMDAVDNFHIFRLGHVAGRTKNQNTVLNFFQKVVNDDIEFDLWVGASRNIIDIDDVSKICRYIIENNLYVNEITNVCNVQNIEVSNIVQIFEQLYQKAARFKKIDKGGSPFVDSSKIDVIANTIGINFDGNYVRRIIYKYYS